MSHHHAHDDSIRQPEGTPDSTVPPTGDEVHWTDARYPVVDADFVGETLNRVLHDRDQIESEAALVDAIRFEHGDLECYRAPAVSAGFVDRTLRLVLAQRDADRRLVSDADAEFEALLEAAIVPEPSPDFVDRTLLAVVADRHSRPRAGRRVLAGRFSLLASVAAILLCSLTLFWQSRSEPKATQPITLTTPVSWAALVTAEPAEEPTATLTLPIVVKHPLERLAREVQGGRR